VVCLYVEEEESIRRQLHRGAEILKHNEIVRVSGLGVMKPVRATDTSEEKARERYHVFKTQVYAALKVGPAQCWPAFICCRGGNPPPQPAFVTTPRAPRCRPRSLRMC
jgi:hypothetical protein